ncbi:TcfC E-set like domain-containing protein [Vibrio campbellii]|nr:TcfC E-set like domain-containing protein [Vibrio campbellii]
MRYNKWFLIFGMFTSSGLSAAPAGFEDLTTLVPADITLVINDDDGMRSFPGSISGQSVRFAAKTHAELHAFLLEQYVAPDVAASLAKSLMNEVPSSSFCFGRRDTCVIDDNEVKSPQIVVVSGKNKVRVLVPSSLMVKKAQSRRFIDEQISEHALVLHHDVHVGAGLDRQPYGYYGGEMVAGLTHGYLRGDVNLTTNRDNTGYDRYLYVDELSWNYLSGHWRLHMGYVSDQVFDNWNATSALYANEKVSSVRVTLGTTSELEYQSKETAPRLYFSVPSSGRLKIKRDDGSPVLERNVSAGQQYVSYSELPRGIHDLTLTVEAGGQEIYREVRKIYNTVNATLEPGETDMLFTAGFFRSKSVFPEWVEEQLPYEEEWENPGYLQGQVMAQVMPSWKVGGSLMNTREMHYAKVATTYEPTSWFSLNAVLGRFGSGSEYVQASGRLGEYFFELESLSR